MNIQIAVPSGVSSLFTTLGTDFQTVMGYGLMLLLLLAALFVIPITKRILRLILG